MHTHAWMAVWLPHLPNIHKSHQLTHVLLTGEWCWISRAHCPNLQKCFGGSGPSGRTRGGSIVVSVGRCGATAPRSMWSEHRPWVRWKERCDGRTRSCVPTGARCHDVTCEIYQHVLCDTCTPTATLRGRTATLLRLCAPHTSQITFRHISSSMCHLSKLKQPWRIRWEGTCAVPWERWSGIEMCVAHTRNSPQLLELRSAVWQWLSRERSPPGVQSSFSGGMGQTVLGAAPPCVAQISRTCMCVRRACTHAQPSLGRVVLPAGRGRGVGRDGTSISGDSRTCD